MWLILALLSAIFAALVAIFGKIGLKNVDSTLATTIRSLVMFIFLFLVTLSTGRLAQLGTINNRALKFIIFSGIAWALSWLFYFAALKIGKAGQVASIDRLSLIFTIILAALFLGEKLTPITILGALLMVSGALLITLAK